MENEVMIRIHDVTKVYKIYEKPIDRLKESLSITKRQYSRDFYALSNINLEICRGENIGIVGTNGAGKSTLLKIITGVLSPTSGNIEVNGKISALLELGAGFNPEYSGIENIYLNGTMMGYSREEMEAKVDNILQFADIGEFIYQPVKTYSSGMFARLAFAVAINVEPEILIVDEALSVGDVRFQMKCMNKMKEMMSGGTTVLFVSHDINAIKRFCSRAIWLQHGKVIESGDVNYVTDKYLDYLKMGETSLEENQKTDEQTPDGEIPFIPGDNIADIVAFHMKNSKGREVDTLTFEEPVQIEIVYDVYDEKVSNPVIGVAMLGMDDKYICGVNTLLDKVKIPWKYGRNRLTLSYDAGTRVLGGKYYFTCAIMDETASVNICIKSVIKQFTVLNDYIGEGVFIIPHKWISRRE